MENLTEQEQAAHQAIAEIVADLGTSFTLKAIADAFYQQARTETGVRGDNLNQAVGILCQLAEVLDEDYSGSNVGT